LIARLWRGRLPAGKVESYRSYVESTGLREYRATPGNLGAYLLTRVDGDLAHVATLSFWDDLESIRAFAGDDVARARYYPKDGEFLLDFPERVEHFDAGPAALGESTVLLVIDVQRALVECLPEARRAGFLQTLSGLLRRARERGIAVVYVRHNDEQLVLGTPGWEIAGAVAPRPGEPVVDKRYRDAFRETSLAEMLGGLQAGHVVLCGMQSEYCVDATLREAERRGYSVTLVEDGHATYASDALSEEQIRANVHRIAQGLAAVRPAAEVFAAP